MHTCFGKYLPLRDAFVQDLVEGVLTNTGFLFQQEKLGVLHFHAVLVTGRELFLRKRTDAHTDTHTFAAVLVQQGGRAGD